MVGEQRPIFQFFFFGGVFATVLVDVIQCARGESYQDSNVLIQQNAARNTSLGLEKSSESWFPGEDDPCSLGGNKYDGKCWADHLPQYPVTLRGMPISGAHNAHAYRESRTRPPHKSDDCGHDNQWYSIWSQVNRGVRWFDIDVDVSEAKGYHGEHLYDDISHMMHVLVWFRKNRCPNDIYWVSVNNVEAQIGNKNRTDAMALVYEAIERELEKEGLPSRNLKILDYHQKLWVNILNTKNDFFKNATNLDKSFYDEEYSMYAGSIILSTPEKTNKKGTPNYGGPYDNYRAGCASDVSNFEECSCNAIGGSDGRKDEVVVFSMFKINRCESHSLSKTAACRPKQAWSRCRTGAAPTVFLMDNVEAAGIDVPWSRCCDGSMTTLRAWQDHTWTASPSRREYLSDLFVRIERPDYLEANGLTQGGEGCQKLWFNQDKQIRNPGVKGRVLFEDLTGRMGLRQCMTKCVWPKSFPWEKQYTGFCATALWYRVSSPWAGNCVLMDVRCSHILEDVKNISNFTFGPGWYSRCPDNTWCTWDRKWNDPLWGNWL